MSTLPLQSKPDFAYLKLRDSRYHLITAVSGEAAEWRRFSSEALRVGQLIVGISYNRRNTLRISNAGMSVLLPFAERNKANAW
jgi:hypothetical protein